MHFSLIADDFVMCFSVVVTWALGSNEPDRPSSSDEEIRRIVSAEVAMAIRGDILETFGSIMNILVENFDERYATVTEVTAVVAIAVVATARP